LTLIDSLASAAALDVATVVDSTAGSVAGTLHLNPSLMVISGNMTLGGGSTLVLDLAGTTRSDGMAGPGKYSAIDVGTASLDGVLRLQLTNGFMPTPGQVFEILSAADPLSGTFAAVEAPNVPGIAWQVVRNTFDVTVTILAALRGDMDLDGDVDFDDIDDFVLGLNNAAAYEAIYGLPPSTHGDTDDDGDQDFDDINGFVSILGGADLARVQAVPEPPAWVLLSLAGSWLVWVMWQR
jgi:hypothetical protein